MKNVLFIVSLVAGLLGSSISSASINFLQDKNNTEDVSQIKCKKISGEVVCSKINDALLPQDRYHCSLEKESIDLI